MVRFIDVEKYDSQSGILDLLLLTDQHEQTERYINPKPQKGGNNHVTTVTIDTDRVWPREIIG